MNDQQLIAALRSLDRQVSPDPAFAEALFVQLRRKSGIRPSRLERRGLLLVAALLAAMAIGIGLAVGAGLLDPTRIVTVPSPAPSAEPTSVEPTVPPLPTLRPPAPSPSIEPGVVATPVPQAAEAPFAIPTWSPGVRLQLARSGGGTIAPTILAIPGSDQAPSVGPLIARGELLWALVSQVYFDDPAVLVRVDTTSNGVRTVPLPTAIHDGSLAGSDIPGELWLSSSEGLFLLDATTGDVLRTFPAIGDSVVGADADGVWLRIVGGIVLVDRDTGVELRRIDSREGEGPAYRGIWRPTAFGSLWDLDRNTGYLYRLDPTTGEEVASIFLAELEPDRCSSSDPWPVTGLGVPDSVVVQCPSGYLVIDPTTNTVARVLPNAGTVVADGAWWSMRFAVDERPGWDSPGSLVRIDPSTGQDLTSWSLNLPRTGTYSPVVVADSLWLVVGERASTNTWFDWNLALVRIPIAELNG